mgnify:CR=1 FL=1
MDKKMNLTVKLHNIDKNGMHKYNFKNLPDNEVSRITEDFANNEKVIVKNRTFISSQVSAIEFGRN